MLPSLLLQQVFKGGNVTIESNRAASKATGPQRLTVRHVSAYRYSEPVRFGEHRMMFGPRSGHDVRVVSPQFVIASTPTRLRWLHVLMMDAVCSLGRVVR